MIRITSGKMAGMTFEDYDELKSYAFGEAGYEEIEFNEDAGVVELSYQVTEAVTFEVE